MKTVDTAICILGAVLCATAHVQANTPKDPLPEEPVARSQTTGVPASMPAIDTNRYTVAADAQAVAIPLEGWEIGSLIPSQEPTNATYGIACSIVTGLVRGVSMPVMRLELARGDYPHGRQPVVVLRRPFNAEEWNTLTFTARTEVPEGIGRTIGDARAMWTGWDAGHFNRYFDDFGISCWDNRFPWVSLGVPSTFFRFHDRPGTRGADGYTDFTWDMRDEMQACNKGFVRDRATALCFSYDTRKIPAGKKVVISIAQPKFVKGVHLKVDEPGRWAAWTNFVANYRPDYSDSSKYLLPPEQGLLARPIRLVTDGVANCEIIPDFSDEIMVGKWFPNPSRWTIYLREERGKERAQMNFAARELRHWLKEITGADVPILLKPSDRRNVKIWLGAPRAKPHFAADLAYLAGDGTQAHDGYGVRARDGDIYIFGASPAGVMYGVYAFLENNTDIIWAFYGSYHKDDPYGTIFTRKPTLDAVWGDAVLKPAMAWRAVWTGYTGLRCGFNIMSGELGFQPAGGHMLSPQYYAGSEGSNLYNPVLDRNHPERLPYWSESNQLCCLADPAFLDHSSEYVPNVKTLKYTGRDCMIIAVDDNLGVCECDYCSAPITNKFGKVLTHDSDYLGYYNAWFYRYLDKLDARIQRQVPGFTTSTYAYFCAAPFPEINISRNIQPQLCTYVRKSQAQPLFAPVNQDWWKIYKDWIRHAPGMMDYDYWGLFHLMYPNAEAVKFDLMAKRDIGIISANTEGSCASGEHLASSQDRWVIARLMWNPDLEVEQLRRYFNRRAFREAAPWMDRFFGVMREAFLRHGHIHIDFEDNRLVADTIRNLGLEGEMQGYLDKALAAVRHPASRVNIEKTKADFTAYMTPSNGDWSYPSQQWEKSHPGLYPQAAETAAPDPAAVKEAQEEANTARKLYRGQDLLGAAAIWRARLAGNGLGSDMRAANANLAELARIVAGTEGLAGIEKLLAEQLDGLEADAEAAWIVHRSILPAMAEAGFTEQAFKLLDGICRDGRLVFWRWYNGIVNPRYQRDLAVAVITSAIKGRKGSLHPVQLIRMLRQYDGDERGHAIGVALEAREWENILGGCFAPAYQQFGAYGYISVLYNQWAGIDGARTPAEYTSDRLGKGVAWMRQAEVSLARTHANAVRNHERDPRSVAHAREAAAVAAELACLRAQLADDVARWHEALAVTVTEGSEHTIRKRAEMTLLRERWDSYTATERCARIRGWVADKFIRDEERGKAAEMYAREFATATSTNWTAWANAAVESVGAGNWSGHGYRADLKRDLRLDYLFKLADTMVAAGRKADAGALLERGAAAMGYTAAYDKPGKDGKPVEAWKTARMQSLDEKMTALGTRRR